MKKMLIVCGLAFVVNTTNTSAQSSQDGFAQIQSWAWNAMTLSGAQSVAVPGGKGILKFNKQGDDFINTLFIDAGGNAFWLIPTEPGIYVPDYPVKFSLSESACFASTDKTIGFCIRKPDDSSSGNNSYLIGLSTSTATVK